MSFDPVAAPRYSKLLRPLQDAVTDRLQGCAEFQSNGIAVLDRRRRNLTSDIDAAIAALGLAIYVFPALPRKATSGSGLWFGEIEIRVRIGENPLLNDKPIDAWDAWELAAQRLDGWKPDNLQNVIHVADDPFADTSDDTLTLFDLVLLTQGGLAPAPDLS